LTNAAHVHPHKGAANFADLGAPGAALDLLIRAVGKLEEAE